MSISRSMEKARHELVTCVIDHTERELVASGVDPQNAQSMAVRVADKLMSVFGGQNITFPMEYHRKLKLRESKIYAAFNGTNLKELATQYNMTERGMRKLLDRVRARKVQGGKP